MASVTHITNQSQFVQSNAVFNGTNISGTIASNAISLSVAAPGAGGDGYNILAAGTQTANTTGTVAFSNSNGITFGMSNNSIITAAHNGLTTAALSNHSHNFATTTTNGASIIVATTNSNGATIGVPAFLTTAQPVGAYLTTARASNDAIGLNTAQSNVTWTVNSAGISLNANGYAGTGFATTTTNGSVVVGTHATNGMTLAVPPYLTTAQAPGAYLTTARASNDAIGLNTAGTNVTWTVNSSGISLNAAAYLTTAALSNHSHGNPTLALTNLSGTTASNSAGLTLSLSAAAPGAGGGVAVANSQTTYTSGTANFVVAGGAMTIASTTGQSFNFSVPATSSFVAVGALTLSTNGSTISISGASVAAAPVNFSAGTTSNNIGSIVFSNSNGISFGLNGSTMTAQHNGLTTARASTDAIGLNTAGTNITWTANSAGLSINAAGYAGTGTTFGGTNISGSITQDSNGIQLSLSAGAAGGGVTFSNWEVFPQANNSTFSSLGQNSFYLQKLNPEANYAFSNVEFRMSGSFVSSSNSQVAAYIVRYGLYSLNGSTYSSIATSQMNISASFNSNTAMGYTISQGAGSFTTTSGGTVIASLMTGMKHLYLPFTSTITAGGQYAFGLHISSATTVGTSPFRMAILNQTVINNLTAGRIFASTMIGSNASIVGDFAQGVGSVTTGAMPSSIAQSALTNAVSQARLYMQLD